MENLDERNDRGSGADDEFGSELRRYIRAEGIVLPKAFLNRSVARIVLAGLLPFALSVLAVVAIKSGIAAVAGWILAFVLVVLAQRHVQTLVHDASHNFFHRNRRINDVIGNWLCAGFIGMKVENYRNIHFRHHAFNGSADDPEHVSFTTVSEAGGLFPMMVRYALMLEAARLIRKYYFQRGGRGRGEGLGGKVPKLVTVLRENKHVVVCQAALIAAFSAASAPLVYPLWLYVAITWSPLLSRLRFLVEHPGESDLTVTTLAAAYERPFFAPLAFNYHFEHHCWPSLPPYRHKEVHRILFERGFFERYPQYIGTSYLRTLVRRSQAPNRCEPAPTR